MSLPSSDSRFGPLQYHRKIQLSRNGSSSFSSGDSFTRLNSTAPASALSFSSSRPLASASASLSSTQPSGSFSQTHKRSNSALRSPLGVRPDSNSSLRRPAAASLSSSSGVPRSPLALSNASLHSNRSKLTSPISSSASSSLSAGSPIRHISMPGSALRSPLPSSSSSSSSSSAAPLSPLSAFTASRLPSLPPSLSDSKSLESFIPHSSSQLESPDTSALLEVGHSEDANPGWREAMEDEVISRIGFQHELEADSNLYGLFALFDGHGGRHTVDFLRDAFPPRLAQNLRKHPRPLEAIQSTLHELDDEMSKARQHLETGSTFACALIMKSKSQPGKRELFVSNVGDSRVVMAELESSTGSIKANRLTRDHRPSSPGEVERIRRAGGFILRGRVHGQLALTRALGDHSLKRAGVVPLAHQKSLHLNPALHKFLIVACDGLFDVLDDQECVSMVAGMRDAQRMADTLVRAAIERGSTDNVSVVVIRLSN